MFQDLKKRLNSSRISHEVLEDANTFDYGFNVNYLKTVSEIWGTQNFPAETDFHDMLIRSSIFSSLMEYLSKTMGITNTRKNYCNHSRKTL